MRTNSKARVAKAVLAVIGTLGIILMFGRVGNMDNNTGSDFINWVLAATGLGAAVLSYRACGVINRYYGIDE